MNTTFVTIGGRPEAVEIELPEHATRQLLLEQIVPDFAESLEQHVFVDNTDFPIELDPLPIPEPGRGQIYHCNTCRSMLVVARYGGDTVSIDISPAAHIARVLERVVKELGIQQKDSEKLFLQFAATGKTPPVNAPLGTVATGPDCDVVFDVLSKPNING